MPVYVESKELYGHSLGYVIVPRIVSRLDAKKAMTTLAEASWLLEKSELDSDAQLFMARVFLEERVREKAIELISQGKTLFFPNQLHILMKYIAKHSRNSGKDIGKEELLSLGRALIAVTEITGSVLKKQKSLRKGLIINSHKERLYEIATKIVTDSYHLQSPNIHAMRFSLARARYLYINLHRLKESEKTNDFMEIGHLFREATGVNLNTFLNIGISIITHLLKQDSGKRTFPQNRDFIFLRPYKMFEHALIDTKDLEKFFELISLSIPELAMSTKDQPNRELAYDFLTMRLKPLIKLEPGVFIPISISYLVHRITVGTYWIILDYLNKAHDSKLSNQFTRYNGYLFQKYVEEIMTHFSQRTAPLDEVLHLDSKYTVRKNELRTPDVMLFGNDYAILIEVSATRLQAKQTISLGIPEAFEADYEKMIVHNVNSLDIFIGNFLKGYVDIEGVDSNSIKHIYPVVVLIEGFPQHFAVDAFLESDLRERNLLSQEQVRGLSILDIQELESIEAYSKISLIEILKSWHRDSQKLIPINQLGIHLRSSISNISNEALSQWSNNLLDEALNDTTMELFGKPLDSHNQRPNANKYSLTS